MPITYPLLMALAIVVGALISRRTQRDLRLTSRQKWGLGLGAFCGSFIGGKLPFVLSDWDGFLSGAAWFTDGKTIMFGLIGGYLGVEIAKLLLDVRVKTGDSFAVPVAVAVAIGRVACFNAGCCYGQPTTLPWGCIFPRVDDQPRHPTQLYETAFHLLAAIMLWQLQRRAIWRGQLIKAYFLAYFAYRFVSEFIRPEPHVLFGLTAYQWGAILFTPVFAVLWWWEARDRANSE
jgi:phosphatidylglycerol:prolipoprotein diacylglycerol transferase